MDGILLLLDRPEDLEPELEPGAEWAISLQAKGDTWDQIHEPWEDWGEPWETK